MLSATQVYLENANFNQSRFKSLSSDNLLAIRMCILMIQCGFLAYNISTNPLNYCVFFISDWAVIVSVVAGMLVIKAALYPEYRVWAFIGLEYAHGMNFAITIAFWTLIKPSLDWDHTSFADKCSYTANHTLPFVASFANILMADMNILKQDWKICMALGYSYLVVNVFAAYYTGHAWYYPLDDWRGNPVRTFFGIQGAVWLMAGLYYFSASLLKAFISRRKED